MTTTDLAGDNATLAAFHAGLTTKAALLSLTPHEAHELRRCTIRAARMGVTLEPGVHYTEGSLRWSGITQQRRSIKRQAPPYADCSSFVTWCFWDASRWLNAGDFINGADWLAGYTGTMVQHGTEIKESQLAPCDVVFYGSQAIPYHTALYTGNGLVISHGREGGPEVVPVGGATQFRRFIP